MDQLEQAPTTVRRLVEGCVARSHGGERQTFVRSKAYKTAHEVPAFTSPEDADLFVHTALHTARATFKGCAAWTGNAPSLEDRAWLAIRDTMSAAHRSEYVMVMHRRLTWGTYSPRWLTMRKSSFMDWLLGEREDVLGVPASVQYLMNRVRDQSNPAERDLYLLALRAEAFNARALDLTGYRHFKGHTIFSDLTTAPVREGEVAAEAMALALLQRKIPSLKDSVVLLRHRCAAPRAWNLLDPPISIRR